MGLTVERMFFSAEKRSENIFNPSSDNTDVIVHLSNGKKYAASFFAYKNIENIVKENIAKNEFLNGKYFWIKNMVLIECCTKELIEEVVQEMLDEGEFIKAFCQL